eukprot:GHVS01059432.1.p1 GENE.GHVS01059432.1~~GHVS01059432.1.p1  ORF type:complete len:142 (-),score=19.23 GHVS01059432.1:249-674(-)
MCDNKTIYKLQFNNHLLFNIIIVQMKESSNTLSVDVSSKHTTRTHKSKKQKTQVNTVAAATVRTVVAVVVVEHCGRKPHPVHIFYSSSKERKTSVASTRTKQRKRNMENYQNGNSPMASSSNCDASQVHSRFFGNTKESYL